MEHRYISVRMLSHFRVLVFPLAISGIRIGNRGKIACTVRIEPGVYIARDEVQATTLRQTVEVDTVPRYPLHLLLDRLHVWYYS
jgi:hypothetical protein